MADIHKVYLSSLFLAYLFQFQNPTLLSSPLLSLLIGSVLARYFQVELAAPSHQSSVRLHITGICFNLNPRWVSFSADTIIELLVN